MDAAGKDYEIDLSPIEEIDTLPPNTETEYLKQTLSRCLRPKEMEALSWQYGLTVNTESKTNAPQNYVAEAEASLYPVTKDIPVRGKWGEAMSFVEVGKNMQVSAEYGWKLCHAALDKLRRATEEGALEPALLF